MAENVIKTRIKHRIDTAENWANLQSPPLKGEFIIYAAEGNIPAKLKIGDGVTTASNLPFITDVDMNNLSAGVRIPESDANSLGSATQGIYWESGRPQLMTYSLNKTVPANAVFTDTNTKVTSAANHYAPQTDSASALSVDASSTTAATWGTTNLVTGVNLTRDAKGHVTGMTVDSIKMPANPNTDTGATAVSVTGTGNAITAASYDSSSRTITLTKGATYNNYSLPNASTALGGVKSGGVATIADGVITAISGASNADTASTANKVANSLAIQGNGAGITFDGSAAKTVNIKGAGTVSVSGATSGVITITGSAHPTALKNPNALTVNVNGTATTYDGSTAKTITINAAALGLSSAMTFGGVVTSLPTSSTAGTVVLYGNKEYVYDDNGNWVELGDEGSHALKTIKINATDGLTGGGTLASDVTIGHSNKITAGTAQGSSGTLNHGGTFTIPKITYDAYGHITGATTTSYTLPADSNTHYTANLYLGASGASSNATTAVSNPYLVLHENSTTRNNIQLKGNAGISISGVSGIATIGHTNSVTAATASEGGSARTLAFGGTFNIPSVTYDAQGHITGKGSITLTMPANPNVDTKVTQAAAITTNGNYPILLGYSTATTAVTNTVNKTSTLLYNPSTGTLSATKFSGNGNTLTNLNAMNLVVASGDELILDCN